MTGGSLYPLHVFNFRVVFKEHSLRAAPSSDLTLCAGEFSECTGLEATMEPKVIKEGGRNYGAAQRSGPVTFATVILKRGVTAGSDLWRWFYLVNTGGYKYRLQATITLMDYGRNDVMSWQLDRALPIKFRTADLNARAAEVGIEELHLAHEGLTVLLPGGTP